MARIKTFIALKMSVCHKIWSHWKKIWVTGAVFVDI
jgi:hypothetical protein